MCYNTKLIRSAAELENRFAVNFPNKNEYHPREIINAFTFPKTPVITNREPKIIQNLQWGLIPAFSIDRSIQKFTLNAKIETLSVKPSFKNYVENRCLILADGFYEWQWLDVKGKRKQKYLIETIENPLFAFAGIFAEWMDNETGEILSTYSIITTEANEFMAEIHNIKKRMPVVLCPENELKWLQGGPIEQFKNVTTPLKAESC